MSDRSVDSGPGYSVALDAEGLARLLAGAGRGDAASWRELVYRYSRRVYALAKSRSRNHDVAEEIAQSVFATLAQKLAQGEYGEEGKFEPWLFRIAANRVRDYIRRQRLAPASADSEVLDCVGVPRAEARQADQAALQLLSLRRAMERLSDADRDVVELRHHGGLSFKQIAEMLGEPIGTLLARHHRALRKLKEEMGGAEFGVEGGGGAVANAAGESAGSGSSGMGSAAVKEASRPGATGSG